MTCEMDGGFTNLRTGMPLTKENTRMASSTVGSDSEWQVALVYPAASCVHAPREFMRRHTRVLHDFGHCNGIVIWRFVGHGTLTFKDGSFYEGEFLDGEIQVGRIRGSLTHLSTLRLWLWQV